MKDHIPLQKPNHPNCATCGLKLKNIWWIRIGKNNYCKDCYKTLKANSR